MASEGDNVMWLRVEDEDIDEAKLLRVTVNENTTGNGKKRRTSFVCKGTLYKGKLYKGKLYKGRPWQEPMQRQ